jgi:LuxR family maltose regulon positive regulatory protein
MSLSRTRTWRWQRGFRKTPLLPCAHCAMPLSARTEITLLGGVDTLISKALLDAGEPIQAVEVLQNVVTVAAPAGIYRTILDCGPEIGLMLPRLRENMERKADSRQWLPYVDHLVEGWRALYQPDQAQNQGGEIAESLTARERGILELIAEGRSNKEIARSLGIAPETVKSHVKNIFDKLSVEKRAQAIARAQSLGLLKST